MKIIVVSGGFDPIHSGHIAYFKSAKSHGDKLIVALNSDAWLEKKKGKFFMPFIERETIVKSIIYVDEVISFDDDSKGKSIRLQRESPSRSFDVAFDFKGSSSYLIEPLTGHICPRSGHQPADESTGQTKGPS